jgi:hypothetical protein
VLGKLGLSDVGTADNENGFPASKLLTSINAVWSRPLEAGPPAIPQFGPATLQLQRPRATAALPQPPHLDHLAEETDDQQSIAY